MKKFAIPFFILGSICIISCRKNRTCTCTYPDGTIATQATYNNVTKKEAQNDCVSQINSVTCTVK